MPRLAAIISAAQRTTPAGPSKGRQDPIARGLDDPSPVTRHETLHRSVRLIKGSPARVVATRSKLFGGCRDVGEQHRRQHAIRCSGGLGLAQEPLDLREDRAVTQEDVVLGTGTLHLEALHTPAPQQLHKGSTATP
jgi:hypothetical protein